MDAIIYLKGNEEKAKEIALLKNSERKYEVLSVEYILQSIKELSKLRLRYDRKTGVVYIGSEWRSRPSNEMDVMHYDSVDEVIEWELMGWILNGASRLQRGFKVD